MKPDYFSDDIAEFIRLLHKFGVRYVIVGGQAVIYYGYPRLTGDVDFFYGDSEENQSALYGALFEFWDGRIPGIQKKQELATPRYIIQFGTPPNRIDLMNHIDGVSFDEAWNGKKTEYIIIGNQKVPVYYLGLRHLLANKKQSGRHKVRDDYEYLKKIQGE